MKYYGRLKPYTEIGITRVPCAHCNKPSTAQWSICANGNRQLGVCTSCDIRLNKMFLKFANIPTQDILLEQYKKQKENQ